MFAGGRDSLGKVFRICPVRYQCRSVRETPAGWCRTIWTLRHQSDVLDPKCPGSEVSLTPVVYNDPKCETVGKSATQNTAYKLTYDLYLYKSLLIV